MKLVLGLLLATAACADVGQEDLAFDPPSRAAALDEIGSPVEATIPKEAFEPLDHRDAGGTATPLKITYHGGPVLTAAPNVYVVWYGAWTGNTAQTIVPAFIGALGDSPYWKINTTYTNAAGAAASSAIKLAGQTTDNYSRGKALTDQDVVTIVATAQAANRLPKDATGIYVVLTSADVNETSGMCSRYCGWHTYATIATAPYKLIYIGNPDRCPSSCEAQSAKSPNANPGADGLISILAHELDETVSDPLLNAWFDSSGAENGDKCAWTFGTTYAAANGSRANVKLGGKDYLIQQNWLNVGAGSCTLAH